MITPNKKRVLQSFCHSRLSGKYSEFSREANEIKINDVENPLDIILDQLELKHLTIENINRMPDSFIASQISYYYEVALNTIDKYIKKDEEIIEAAIALSILAYLEDEKGIKETGFNITDLLSQFEKVAGNDRKTVTKMIMTGTKIVEAVEKANFNKHLKKNRKK